jgi:hypothetical protein
MASCKVVERAWRVRISPKPPPTIYCVTRLRQLDDVVLHVHDEIVLETDRPQEMAEKLERVMCTPPSWAEGLPLGAEVAIMSVYGK